MIIPTDKGEEPEYYISKRACPPTLGHRRPQSRIQPQKHHLPNQIRNPIQLRIIRVGVTSTYDSQNSPALQQNLGLYRCAMSKSMIPTGHAWTCSKT